MPSRNWGQKLEHGFPHPLTVDDFVALDALGGVARVDDELRLLDDLGVVVIGMVGHDQDAVVLAKIVEGRAFHLQVVTPALADRREVRIVVTDLRTFLLQKLDDSE